MAATIQDIMIRNPVTLRPNQSLFSARELMVLHDYECLYVVDEAGRPVGLVPAVALSGDPAKRTVDKVMRADFPRVAVGDTVQTAAKLLATGDANHLAMAVVGVDGTLEGIVRVKDVVKDLARPTAAEGALSPEAAALFLAMTKTPEKERFWVEKIRDHELVPGVTQVGANAEKLPIKMRESAIVAAIAYRVIKEDSREKTAVSNAIREIILQMRMISPGLGGGFKLGIVRGEGRVAVAAFGRSGHALVNSNEQVFLGTSIC